MIQALVFDWHGVLDRRTFRHLIQHFAEAVCERRESSDTEECVRQTFRRYVELGNKLSAAEITPVEFWAQCAEDVGELRVTWGREYFLTVEKNDPLWALFPGLKQRYRLIVLSDCPQDKLDIIKGSVDLRVTFDASFFSCEYKMNKTESKFFKVMLSKTGLEASRCFFIDDQEKNLKIPYELGFKVQHYTGDNAFLHQYLGNTT